jgi:TOMM system kinase/cyclase fusion protein
MPDVREAILPIGCVFQGGYEILSELGAGSFGRVYKARQLSTSQSVAVKILRLQRGDPTVDSKNLIERFRREMRLCGELSHPNIVRLIDSGESHEGILYAVFEFVPGLTLKAVLAEEGKLNYPETVHLMTQVLDALSCAHARGVVHRDLKPENIMLTKTGARRNALVLDFGLGGLTGDAGALQLPQITMTPQVMGTPSYAAPEQLRGERASTRSDLYSWGLVFLECLTGELAVSGASVQEIIFKQLGAEPIRIPTWLQKQRLGGVLQAVTAKQVEKRDVTIEGLLQALSLADFEDLHEPRDSVQTRALTQGERRQLTLVCCRLHATRTKGSPLDLEELDELLHAEQAICVELAGRAGGYLVGVMADRCLLAFGYPQAHEDDARRAARAALNIAAEVERASTRLQAERGLRIETRVGVHTGLVIARELRRANRFGLDELVGLTPQITLALQEQAEPGEVLASLPTQRLLRGEIDAFAVREMKLPDSLEHLPVFRLSSPQAKSLTLETTPQETPLVGRANQLKELFEAWDQAQAGRPRVAFLRGEPGIGKSRLLRELRRHVDAGGWLECRCLEGNRSVPLRPFIDLLSSIDEPVESLLSRYGFDLAETLPLFQALLSQLGIEHPASLPYSRERQKELTLNALVTLLFKLADARPRVLAIEDLHWADPTTLELANLIVQEVRAAEVLDGHPSCHLCVVFTARPEFDAPWPTVDTVMIQPPRLGREEVEAMINAGLSHERSLSKATVDEIIRRADGIPLFVEEVTHVLLEGGMPKSDAAGLTGRLAPTIPSTLRDLLTARLDGLSRSAKETAQLAAVIGREFRYEILKASSSKDEPALREDLRDLSQGGMVFRRRSVRSETYAFKHVLVCETAYGSLVRPVRQNLHRRVANVLRQRFPDLEQNRPEVLAQHFEGAGDLNSAADYYHRAGSRAMKRGAYVEAAQQLEQGLALLRTEPESSDRDQLEVELLTTLGTVQFSTKGYGSKDVERTFSRARDLGERLGREASPKVLTGIMGVYFTRSDRESTAALLPIFQELARRSDPVSAITGHATLGLAALFEGNLMRARECLDVARRYYGTDEFQTFARAWGYDGGMLIYAWQMIALWQLGYPDQAEALRREMMSIAEATKEPYSLLFALSFGTTLTDYRGDTAATRELAGRLMTLSTEQRLYGWLASAMIAQGGTLLGSGDAHGAIAQISQGLDLFRAAGVMLSYSWFLPDLAAAYGAAGKISEGLATVNEGLSRCENELLRFQEPELWRVKGELELREHNTSTAEASFRRAIEISQARHAKSFELRAAIGLSHLLRQRGKVADARSLLASVYEWFGEGFETRDLRNAKGQLASLT